MSGKKRNVPLIPVIVASKHYGDNHVLADTLSKALGFERVINGDALNVYELIIDEVNRAKAKSSLSKEELKKELWLVVSSILQTCDNALITFSNILNRDLEGYCNKGDSYFKDSYKKEGLDAETNLAIYLFHYYGLDKNLIAKICLILFPDRERFVNKNIKKITPKEIAEVAQSIYEKIKNSKLERHGAIMISNILSKKS